uniref:Uncharacterized protein n=1 Tax=Coconut foliar decay virus TaxID=12474 RepID=A0A2R4N9C9_9VIRU|nr:hypothetical protein [Coconut foliar decay virus]AVX29448.1 hypothetical protein [Coconut foliar decay virus]AVX29450.1 hypothetical protein [Coconut foliar decay virus]
MMSPPWYLHFWRAEKTAVMIKAEFSRHSAPLRQGPEFSQMILNRQSDSIYNHSAVDERGRVILGRPRLYTEQSNGQRFLAGKHISRMIHRLKNKRLTSLLILCPPKGIKVFFLSHGP